MVSAAKSKIAQKEKSDLLYRAILTLKNEEECYSFFQDLCTISELRSMEQRYEVATLLNDGMLYSDILEKTGASSATISRVNRSLPHLPLLFDHHLTQCHFSLHTHLIQVSGEAVTETSA